MPIPLPQLDDRTFDELVSDGQALLPRYAPGWTDHNVHDPGITLMELFAWLTEMGLYRLDRVPEASMRAFLRLMGIEPRPAQVADTVLVASPAELGAGAVPADRSQITTANQAVTFQATHRLWVSPAKLVTILAGPEGALTDSTNRNDPSSKSFPPFGSAPLQNHALYLGFDQQLANVSETIQLYVWTADPVKDRETRAALIAEQEAMKKMASHCPLDRQLPTADWRHHYSVRTVWEYGVGVGQWEPLSEVVDETRALTLSGAIRFKAPEAMKHVAGGVAGRSHANRYFIRCRVVSGQFECPPVIRYVQINTVRACHVVDRIQRLLLGRSTGRAGQTYQLPDRPIVPGSTTVRVQVGASEQTWNESLIWDRLGPHAHGYVLHPERGEIHFGNGRVGAVPPAGAELSVTYQVGGGPAGNVEAQSLTRLATSPASSREFTQPFAASGGASAESLFDAKARAVAWLSQPHRAVTLRDFEQLALATPGVPVARVKALAEYDPALPCVTAPGSITVIVIPQCPRPRPTPGPEFLRAVTQYLNRRRLVTTEVHVIGPEYTTVAVQATLHVGASIKSSDLIAQATAKLNQFLDPLEGGPDGRGWPIGRAVYRSEILAVLNGLPGVRYVDGVSLDVVDETKTTSSSCCGAEQAPTKSARCGNVEICPHGLVVPGHHRITISVERAEQ